ncbi:MAG: 50S ribosomal protein L24 [Verrucomicrobia bacterium]|nr:50S ribosomal protein L24 [Verrucomicrobiota bacterium]
MATKFHVKRNDQVVVIAGSHKGKSGKVLEILAGKQRARVEGVAMIKKHLKKSEKNPQGAISELEGSVHISNLMLQSAFDASKRKKAAPAA